MNVKIPVAVMGATGSVGQRFIQLLDGHPWFEVVALSASDRSVGKRYGEAVHWILPEPMPAWAAEMPVLPTRPDALQVPLAFSALPTEVAGEAESAQAQAGTWVCSNASAHRRDDDVPILLPEVNPQHLKLVQTQRARRSWTGGIVCNANCTSTGLTVTLKALQGAFGVARGFVVSLQALSGAGYPGVASLDIVDNALPFIPGEEEKMEWEPRKMLGELDGGEIHLADLRLSAQANRVAVSDAHLVCLSVELRGRAGIEEVAQALREYGAPQESRELPSAPHPPIVLRSEPDRPQPRLDRMTGGGMTTVVGRLRPDPLLDYKMVILSHNTIRGAAGGSIYNAELLVDRGYVG
jgi:aspartate-semialdehyde dehydrogenase